MITKQRLTIATSITISVGFSVAFLMYFLPDEQRFSAFDDVGWTYLIPVPFVYLISLYLRSKRWSVILTSAIDTPPGSLLSSVLVGYMINAIAPVRLGDFVRGYYVALREKSGLLTVMGTLAVEKAFDTGTVLVLFALGGLAATALLSNSTLFSTIPGGIPTLVVVALLPTVGVLGMFWFVRRYGRKSPGIDYENGSGWTASKLWLMITNGVGQFSSGTDGLASRRVTVETFAYSLVIWALEAFVYTLVGVALGAHDALPSFMALFAVMCVVVAVVNIAIAIPTMFGGLGTFELVAAATITSVGVDSGIAGATVITIHVMLLATGVVAGAVALTTDRRARQAFRARFSRNNDRLTPMT